MCYGQRERRIEGGERERKKDCEIKQDRKWALERGRK